MASSGLKFQSEREQQLWIAQMMRSGVEDADAVVLAFRARCLGRTVTIEPAEPAEPRLVDYDRRQKIGAIKELRCVTGLGLREAKEIVEALDLRRIGVNVTYPISPGNYQYLVVQ